MRPNSERGVDFASKLSRDSMEARGGPRRRRSPTTADMVTKMRRRRAGCDGDGGDGDGGDGSGVCEGDRGAVSHAFFHWWGEQLGLAPLMSTVPCPHLHQLYRLPTVLSGQSHAKI
jgi:hypothetical protein